ncbi:class I SAM-dependent methyltransferase [Pelomonas sp. P7]|uniref:Class I SAM-dependent methyltransferase n=1 Tax=Pelomonas caseinilytica TaxID=2906763 RepID=A0ABS8XEL3_9BURK|nr:class I SAM-dependent methyltransferase [Pelomonas sp. P7]MCE4538160.1 class I SAM-dependent methyltransferase [Pelomonas sp. P7]
MPTEVVPLSFRDPIARVVAVDGVIHRAVAAEHAAHVETLLRSRWLQTRVERGDMPASDWCAAPPGCLSWGDDWRWIRHQTLEMPLYPHEITSQQLYDAALLTLDLAQDALSTGHMLKDASAWNVLHVNGRAVFVDLTSFVPHDGSPLWLAYGQFGRHFVIPLLLSHHLRMSPADTFVRHRDGLTPEFARRLLGRWRSFSSLAAAEFIGLPAMLRDARRVAPSPQSGDMETAVQAHQALLARLRGVVQSLEPTLRRRNTNWSRYTAQRDHYTREGLALKHAFLTRRLASGHGRLLDLGCNTGEYALHAAQAGRSVIAADIDEQSLQELHQGKAALPISTLLLDLANPGPALGWRNAEVAPTLSRARGRFGTVLCVGLLHHLLVTVRVPLTDVLEFLSDLGPHELLIEWIPPHDRKFQEIAGPNLPLYEHLNQAVFEAAIASHWVIEERHAVPGNERVLYALRRTVRTV